MKALILAGLTLTYTSFVCGQVSLPQAITISGGVCINSQLTVTTPVPAQEIDWTLNGTTVVQRQQATLQTSATTIAGGTTGSGPIQLSAPDRLFVDDNGDVYIPDLGNNRVVKWAAGSGTGVVVAGGNGTGSAANQFNRPTSVFVDRQGNIYIADQSNNRVQKWAPGAAAGVTVAGLSGELSGPTDVFIDAQGALYVSSQYSNTVYKYPPGSTTPAIVATGNGMSSPTGIFVDANGNLYVCDTDYSRILKWTPGATTATVVVGSAGAGNGANQIANPLDIYVDCAGNLYIADYSNNRVQKWAPGATFGTTVLGTGTPGSAANQLNTPASVFLDGNYNIYVSDFGNNRVQEVSYSVNRSYTPTAAGVYTATVNTGCGTITSNAVTIGAGQTPQVQISASSTFACNGSPVVFTATPTNGGASPSYQWKRNGVLAGTNSATYTDPSPVKGEVVSCTITSSDPCVGTPTGISNDIVLTEVLPPSLGANLTVCPGATVRISAGPGYSTYLWQDGSADSIFTAAGPGVYYVDVTDYCHGQFSDTLTIGLYPTLTGFLPADTAICSYDDLILSSSTAFNSFNWSDGSAGATVTVSHEGWYWLQGIDGNGCLDTDSVLVSLKDCPPAGIYVPGGFTPNGDGRNDLFKPVVYGSLASYEFSVFNRNGQLVFTSKDTRRGWDGRVNGHIPSSNVFVWFCSYQIKGRPLRVEKGTVVLIE